MIIGVKSATTGKHVQTLARLPQIFIDDPGLFFAQLKKVLFIGSSQHAGGRIETIEYAGRGSNQYDGDHAENPDRPREGAVFTGQLVVPPSHLASHPLVLGISGK